MTGSIEKQLNPQIKNAPLFLSSFVGRELELVELERHLANPDCRLLTIFGPGGIGKTRLALETAREQLNSFADGVYFIPLASVTELAFTASAFAQSLGFVPSGNQPTQIQLLAYLSEKSLLLIVDNFEHLTEQSDWLGTILEAAPHVKMIVTSRQRLQTQYEWVFEIQGLFSPESDGDDMLDASAVRLFLERAQRTYIGFTPDAADKLAILRICKLVDGLPLALELAATWVRMMPCHDIANAITQGPQILNSTLRDIPERQRSIKLVIEKSWQLLSDDQRRVFRCLSVFRGGFRFEGAEAIVKIDLTSLAALVDQSLIRGTPTGRYEIHELLRQFGAERLQEYPGELAEMRQRHALYYLVYLRQHEAELIPNQIAGSFRTAAVDIHNIRLAWSWAVEQINQSLLLETLDVFCKFHQVTSQLQEAEITLAHTIQALEASSDSERDNILHCKLLVRQARFLVWTAKFVEGKALLEKSLSVARALDLPAEIALILNTLGLTQTYLGQSDEAKQLCLQSLSLYQSLGNEDGIAECHHNLSFIASRLGNFAAVSEHIRNAITLYRKLGDSRNLARSLSTLGFALFYTGDYESAKRVLEESYAISTQADYKAAAAGSLYYLGIVHAAGLGLYEQAEQFYREALSLYKEIGNREGTANSIQGLADLAYRLNSFQDAKQYFLEFLDLKRKIGDPYGTASALSGLADVACQLGENALSLQYFQEALSLANHINATGLLLSIFPGLALLLSRESEKEAALALLALTEAHPMSVPQTKEAARQNFVAMYPEKQRSSLERVSPESILVTSTIRTLLRASGLPRSVWSSLLSSLDPSPRSRSILDEPLTEREFEVLRLLADGLSNPEIAERLFLGTGTIKTYTLTIYRKLDVRSRTQAVLRAQELGLL